MPAKMLLVAGAAGLLLTAVTAAQARQEPQPVPAKPAEKKICKMIVPVGTTLDKRFCLTKSEWKELSERTQNDAALALARRGAGMCDINC